MFTGLVQDLGTVGALHDTGAGARLHVTTRLGAELAEGDSIAVDGVCLTATEVGPDAFAAEAMHETLRRSSLGDLRAGAGVNLELPLRVGDRLGGHIVQGHVDAVGTVEAVESEGFANRVTIAADAGVLRYVVEKGSIAVAGVSLTVVAVEHGRFAVALIPETLQRTSLGGAHPGDRVNLEVDVLAKHVERLLAHGVDVTDPGSADRYPRRA